MRKFIEIANGILLLSMLAIVLVQIAARSILHIPSSWSGEVARYLFVIIVFVGAAGATKGEEHIFIDVLVHTCSDRVKAMLQTVGILLRLIFLGYVIAGCSMSAIDYMSVGIPTATWLKLGYIYAVMALCAAVMVVYSLMNIVKNYKFIKEKRSGFVW